ncbi:MAG: hypothetical protein Q7T54_03020, partial [Candidatus Levybacteria bacterium]|nr:hypothetical protein [Candidatus Levybacteria bacterium]
NGEYMRKMSAEELGRKLKEFDGTITQNLSDSEFLSFVKSAQTRMKLLSEFKNYITPFLIPVSNKSELLAQYGNALEQVSDWNSANISNATVAFMQEKNIRYPQIYSDIIGQKQGLPLGDVFEILGKEKTFALLK